jgi:regulator of protease activity HflC (stomatin/prohibitin superfamily)
MALSARIVKQYEQGVLFRLGRVQGPRNPGFRLIIPFIDVQQRNLQSLVEIGVDKNTTVVFPAPLMTTIAELGSFLAGEKAAAGLPAAARSAPGPVVLPGPGAPPQAANGSSPAPASG